MEVSPLSLVHIKLQCSEKNENNTFSKKKKQKTNQEMLGWVHSMSIASQFPMGKCVRFWPCASRRWSGQVRGNDSGSLLSLLYSEYNLLKPWHNCFG